MDPCLLSPRWLRCSPRARLAAEAGTFLERQKLIDEMDGLRRNHDHHSNFATTVARKR